MDQLELVGDPIKSDELGFNVARDRVHVHDLHATILQLFNDMVPPDMRDKLPPEILEQMEKLKE